MTQPFDTPATRAAQGERGARLFGGSHKKPFVLSLSKCGRFFITATEPELNQKTPAAPAHPAPAALARPCAAYFSA